MRIEPWPCVMLAWGTATVLAPRRAARASPRGRSGAREREILGMDRFAHIAIDGPAGSGKTTVARALARRLDILYLDTGAMYRALAYAALQAQVDPADSTALLALAAERPIRVVRSVGGADGFAIYAGDEPLGDELFVPAVSRVVSVVAARPEVRELMVARQRAVAAMGPVVMAGRDIGTVVLPDAAVKIYLTASLAERVERRRAELARRGVSIAHDTLEAQMHERDRLDETRAVAPLRPAADCVEIDSTGMTVDDVVDRVAAIVRTANA